MAKGKTKEKAADKPSANTMPVPANIQLPAGFKAKRLVTVPTLVIKGSDAPARILTINDAMRESTYKDSDPTKAKEKPATICGVTDAQDGAVYQFIVPSVVEANLKRDYPNDGYVTKSFRIQCLGKRPGKRYWDFSVMEVEAE